MKNTDYSQPKKSLGQHFLIDKNILSWILKAAALTKKDIVLEIGAGRGILTQALADTGCQKVVALEIDDTLIECLQETFRDYQSIEIVHHDVLKLDLEKFIKEKIGNKKGYKLVSNLPYYIATHLIQSFLRLKHIPLRLVVMVQQEVGEKMVAHAPEMNYLAVVVQFYTEVHLLKKVSKNCFFPKPKVDSVIVELIPFSRPRLPHKLHNLFFTLIKAGFAHRRKTIANALHHNLHLDHATVTQSLQVLGLSPMSRAQELGVEQWVELFTLLQKSLVSPKTMQ